MKLIQITKTREGQEAALHSFDSIIKHLRKKGCKRLFLCARIKFPNRFFVAREWDSQDDEYCNLVNACNPQYGLSKGYTPVPLGMVEYREIIEKDTGEYNVL